MNCAKCSTRLIKQYKSLGLCAKHYKGNIVKLQAMPFDLKLIIIDYMPDELLHVMYMIYKNNKVVREKIRERLSIKCAEFVYRDYISMPYNLYMLVGIITLEDLTNDEVKYKLDNYTTDYKPLSLTYNKEVFVNAIDEIIKKYKLPKIGAYTKYTFKQRMEYGMQRLITIPHTSVWRCREAIISEIQNKIGFVNCMMVLMAY